MAADAARPGPSLSRHSTIRATPGLSFRYCSSAANTLSLSGIYQPRKDGSIRFPAALEQYLTDHPGVKRIVLCLDNDEPGRAASAAIQKKLSEYEVIDNPPRRGKDYNDQLQLVKGISGRVRTRGGEVR